MELLFEAQNLVRSGVAVLGFLLWPYLLPILVGLLLFLCIPRLFPKNGNISFLILFLDLRPLSFPCSFVAFASFARPFHQQLFAIHTSINSLMLFIYDGLRGMLPRVLFDGAPRKWMILASLNPFFDGMRKAMRLGLGFGY